MGFSSGLGVGGTKIWKPKKAPDNPTNVANIYKTSQLVGIGFTANDNGSPLIDVPSTLGQSVTISPNLSGSVANVTTDTKQGSSHNMYITMGTAPTQGQSYTFTFKPENAVGKASSTGSLSLIPFPKPTVEGGVLYSDSTYYYRLFTSSVYSGQAGGLKVNVPFEPTSSSVTLNMLLVAPGGGGTTGRYYGVGAGGGAGGIRNFSVTVDYNAMLVSNGQFDITLGSAGSGSYIDANGNWYSGWSGDGSTVGYYVNSSGSPVYTQRYAFGGGGGRGYWVGATDYPYTGGSGGGAGVSYWMNSVAGIAVKNQAGADSESLANVGNNGGYSSLVGQYYYGAGGGGGAGSVGGNGNGSTTTGGAGGSGINTYSSWLAACGINNYSGYIAGGGGGTAGAYDYWGVIGFGTPGAAGIGGGGAGKHSDTQAGNNGGQYSGGGGGALGTNAANGSSLTYAGNGGSGFLIVRYLKTEVA